jgi:hypothetical protein
VKRMVHFYQGYHPFYITDDPEGGYEFKTAQERKKVKVFAGTTKAARLSQFLVWCGLTFPCFNIQMHPD